MLPRTFAGPPLVPPLKSQGIKTRLLSFLFAETRWEGEGRWIEPFCGSGVVAFNLAPPRALLADANPAVITFYSALQQGTLTPDSVEEHLAREGVLLEGSDGDHYYAVRERFNAAPDPHDWLFLNRSCFNGLVRFNRKGGFNVPFCRKPARFSRAYRTKIVNQVRRASDVIAANDWTFALQDWTATLTGVSPADFVYLDPPYIGRHADYYLGWSDACARALAARARELPCPAALSMWLRNRFRENDHVAECWPDWSIRTTEHFYHVGSRESLRHAVVEAVVVNRRCQLPGQSKSMTGRMS